MTQAIILAEGKTKKIMSVPGRHAVDIVSKDWITAGDGAKRHLLPGKGALSTTTTVNALRLLEDNGFDTHFEEQIDAVTFRASLLTMIPVEFVARGVATGSYLKRNPDVAKGTRFGNPVIELFLKDDANHDPIMVCEGGRWVLYRAAEPISSASKVGELPEDHFRQRCGVDLNPELTHDLMKETGEIFLTLERAWERQKIVIPDFKIEYGCHRDLSGKIVVGDVLDNDSWRLWPGGDPAKELSKQVYRDKKEITEADLEDILCRYAQVAGRTHLFFNTN